MLLLTELAPSSIILCSFTVLGLLLHHSFVVPSLFLRCSFIVPLILLVFRNSEIISLLVGRSIAKENYIAFNLDELSNFLSLRIIAYRNQKKLVNCSETNLSEIVEDEVNKLILE